jgi:hypothetical protein
MMELGVGGVVILLVFLREIHIMRLAKRNRDLGWMGREHDDCVCSF